MKQPNKLPQEVVDLLLPLIGFEFKAFYFYRSLSNWCKGIGYDKAAEYFAKESDDELIHAKKLEDFLVLWNVTPILPLITQPELEFTDLADGIQKAYDLEYALYEEYEEASIKIFKIGDVCAFDTLQFFRNQQTQSVGEYSDMINILDGVNTKDKFQMLLLEQKLF